MRLLFAWLRPRQGRASVSAEQKRRRYELASGTSTVHWAEWTPEIARRLKR
jgi:hypothetical protein